MVLNEIDSKNVKAMFRAATALSKLEKHNEAMVFIKHSLRLEPKNKAIRALYKTTKEVITQGQSKWVEGMTQAMSSNKYEKLIKQDEDDQILRQKKEQKRASLY